MCVRDLEKGVGRVPAATPPLDFFYKNENGEGSMVARGAWGGVLVEGGRAQSCRTGMELSTPPSV